MERDAAKARQLDEDLVMVDSVGMRQRVEQLNAPPTAMEVYGDIPHVAGDPTYYERPLLKQPTWIWTVPAYFYAGGLGGAAAIIAGALDWRGEHEPARRLRRTALLATVVGSGLLVADLGRPERFLNMLRVLRVTSPMSVGSWVLAANGATLGCSVGSALLRERVPGPWGAVARISGYQAALLSSIQCTYPAVLLCCTAVPIWQQTRHALPFLFAASAISSVGSLADLMGWEEPGLAIFSNAGKALELAASVSVEKEAELAPERVGQPFREGLSGKLWRASAVLTGASLALTLWPGKSPWRRRLSGLCGTAGALALRFAALEAGKASARDPRASFHTQRQRLALSQGRTEKSAAFEAAGPSLARE